MAEGSHRLVWQIPLMVLACVTGSLGVVWAVSGALGFTMNPSLVAILSAVASAVAIAARRRPRGI